MWMNETGSDEIDKDRSERRTSDQLREEERRAARRYIYSGWRSEPSSNTERLWAAGETSDFISARWREIILPSRRDGRRAVCHAIEHQRS